MKGKCPLAADCNGRHDTNCPSNDKGGEGGKGTRISSQYSQMAGAPSLRMKVSKERH